METRICYQSSFCCEKYVSVWRGCGTQCSHEANEDHPILLTLCRRKVTADAIGMAKVRGRREGEKCRWCRNRVGHKHCEEHHDVPRFGALRRDNTPTPACLFYINAHKNYNNCCLIYSW